MTLIAGIRGVEKSFIAADSRQVIIADGMRRVSDDAQKWQQLGRYSVTAVAGDALLAAFIIRKFADLLGDTPTFSEVKKAFVNHLELFSREYLLTKNSDDTNCAILLCGYDNSMKDSFDAGRIGDVLGAGVKKHGEGMTVHQNIHTNIIQGMRKAMKNAAINGQNIQKGSSVEIDSPLSELTGYQILHEDRNVFIETKKVGNFEAIFYGADSQFNVIEIPDEILSEIYFRDIDGMDAEAIIKSDTIWIVAFMTDVIKKRGYKEVGGNIFPLLITPEGGTFYAESISKQNIHNGKVSTIRKSTVIDGRLCFINESGKPVRYQSLFDLADRDISRFDVRI